MKDRGDNMAISARSGEREAVTLKCAVMMAGCLEVVRGKEDCGPWECIYNGHGCCCKVFCFGVIGGSMIMAANGGRAMFLSFITLWLTILL